MKTTLQLTAVGLLLAAVGSAATAVPLNFDSGLVKDKKPTRIDDQVVQGFKFSGGVWAFDADAKVPGADDSLEMNTGGFVANRNDDTSANGLGKITISITEKGRFFQSVLLRYYTGGNLFVTGFSDGKQVFEDDPFTPGQLNWYPAFPSNKLNNIDFDPTKQIDTLQFRALSTTGGNNTFLALDNLDFTLTGGSNPVPEPASYALVGLALLAAGAARRRA